jgi:hypothetical protein
LRRASGGSAPQTGNKKADPEVGFFRTQPDISWQPEPILQQPEPILQRPERAFQPERLPEQELQPGLP